MLMPRTQTRSIGEVLALLKTEFDDITISKIRFLESQGLVTPERTQSGYRKFSEDDVARLRYILRQQKEHFLPLKVIKGRLSESEGGSSDGGGAAQHEGSPSAPSGIVGRADLLRISGLSESQARELEGFGLLKGQKSADGTWYDEDALSVARLAGRFLSFGVDARHLRIFKTAADREADLYRQMTPGARGHRNTQARMDAEARLAELAQTGSSLHAELLRQALGAE